MGSVSKTVKKNMLASSFAARQHHVQLVSTVPASTMSEVIKLDSDKWILEHKLDEPLRTRLQFAGSPIVFDVYGSYNGDGTHKRYGISVGHYEITFTADPDLINQISYLVEYRLQYRGQAETGAFNETTTKSPELFPEIYLEHRNIVSIKLTLRKVTVTPFFYAVNADMRAYIERGPTVTLIGSDGSVSIPRRLLEMRSEAFEAMFKHNSQEKRLGQVKMEDFDSKTLSALKQYLMTGRIENGKETALGLIILGDKYNVQSMKKAGEDNVKQNIQGMDKEEVLDILHKVSRETLVDAMIANWSKK